MLCGCVSVTRAADKDLYDGELMPTLENRRTFTRLIREWQADVVIGPRPCDYHPEELKRLFPFFEQ